MSVSCLARYPTSPRSGGKSLGCFVAKKRMPDPGVTVEWVCSCASAVGKVVATEVLDR